MTDSTLRPRPDASRRRRAWMLAGVGAAGVGVAGLSAGTAAADPVTDQAVSAGASDPLADAAAEAGRIAGTVGEMARAAGIPVPDPITPDAPGGQAGQAVLPTTLLRRDESAETAPQTTPVAPVAAGGPAGGAGDGAAGQAGQSGPQFAPGAVTKARAVAGDADAAAQVGRGVTKAITDPSVIGDVIAAIEAPTGYDIDQTIKQTSRAITDVVTGKVLADAQAAIEATLSGPEFADWASNTANPFAQRDGSGWERAADGVAAAIDNITRDPAGFAAQAVVEGGGVARLATDPAGFARTVVEKIAGPDILADIDVVIGDYVVPSLIDAVTAAAPAALIPAAAFLPGFLAGTGLAAPWTSGLGAAAGALNPLAHLVGLATSLLGAPVGALATGIPGFIASGLITLPIALIAPLLGAAAGSALGLAGWASLVYGAWAATLIPVTAAAIGLGGVAGVAATALLIAISGANPIMIPAAIGGGILTFLFVATMIVGGYTLATVLIPTVIYLLGVIPVLLAGLGAGLLAGLIPGLAAPLIGIPLITGASAIPGAILGGIGGYLVGDLATRALSAAIGAGLGALAAPLLGGVPGGLLTAALSLPATILAALALAGMSLNNSRLNMSGRVRDCLDDLTRALTEGWNRSRTKRVLDALMRNWSETQTGRDMTAAQNAWWRIGQMLGGRIHGFVDPNVVIRDAATGGGIGAVLGGLLGALVGGLAGLLNPANLLGGIPGFLGGAALGAPIGGLLGLIPPLLAGPLAGLASLPLTFGPNLLAVLATEGALMLPAILAATAIALIPPAVLATAAWIIGSLAVSAPLWIPLTIASTALTLVAFALSNPLIAVAFPPAAALIPFAFAIGAVGAGLAVTNLAVIAGALGLGLVTIWPATFLLTAPLFIFPALAVPLALLASLPLALPIAAGMSLAESIAIGSVVAGLTALLTVPAGLIAGGLAGGLTGAGLGVLVTAVSDALLGATIGAELSSLPGGAVGALIGAIIGALRSSQVHIDPPVADLHFAAGGGDTPAPAPAPEPEPAPVEVPAAMLPDYAVDTAAETAEQPVPAGV